MVFLFAYSFALIAVLIRLTPLTVQVPHSSLQELLAMLMDTLLHSGFVVIRVERRSVAEPFEAALRNKCIRDLFQCRMGAERRKGVLCQASFRNCLQFVAYDCFYVGCSMMFGNFMILQCLLTTLMVLYVPKGAATTAELDTKLGGTWRQTRLKQFSEW